MSTYHDSQPRPLPCQALPCKTRTHTCSLPRKKHIDQPHPTPLHSTHPNSHIPSRFAPAVSRRRTLLLGNVCPSSFLFASALSPSSPFADVVVGVGGGGDALADGLLGGVGSSSSNDDASSSSSSVPRVAATGFRYVGWGTGASDVADLLLRCVDPLEMSRRYEGVCLAMYFRFLSTFLKGRGRPPLPPGYRSEMLQADYELAVVDGAGRGAFSMYETERIKDIFEDLHKRGGGTPVAKTAVNDKWPMA